MGEGCGERVCAVVDEREGVSAGRCRRLCGTCDTCAVCGAQGWDGAGHAHILGLGEVVMVCECDEGREVCCVRDRHGGGGKGKGW